MDGFINVNKAQGMTSFDVIRKLKRIFPRTKLGHLGTLDPMAQGVLPVAIGFATRVIEYVAETDKVYRATMTLGGVSDTQDAWGNITYKSDVDIDDFDLSVPNMQTLFKKYTGLIRQIPPMYSAVHHEGQRLYELARQGITVDREAREIEIEYIKLLSMDLDGEGRPLVNIEVGCSKGTYIRTLCHDIGTELGSGAYLSALTRIRAGVFTIEESYALEDIEKRNTNFFHLIEEVDFPLQHIPEYTIDSSYLDRLFNGNRIDVDEGCSPGLVRVYEPQGSLIAIANCRIEGNRTYLQPLKVFKSTSH